MVGWLVGLIEWVGLPYALRPRPNTLLYPQLTTDQRTNMIISIIRTPCIDTRTDVHVILMTNDLSSTVCGRDYHFA